MPDVAEAVATRLALVPPSPSKLQPHASADGGAAAEAERGHARVRWAQADAEAAAAAWPEVAARAALEAYKGAVPADTPALGVIYDLHGL